MNHRRRWIYSSLLMHHNSWHHLFHSCFCTRPQCGAGQGLTQTESTLTRGLNSHEQSMARNVYGTYYQRANTHAHTRAFNSNIDLMPDHWILHPLRCFWTTPPTPEEDGALLPLLRGYRQTRHQFQYRIYFNIYAAAQYKLHNQQNYEKKVRLIPRKIQ